jgi:hypothetical protein
MLQTRIDFEEHGVTRPRVQRGHPAIHRITVPGVLVAGGWKASGDGAAELMKGRDSGQRPHHAEKGGVVGRQQERRRQAAIEAEIDGAARQAMVNVLAEAVGLDVSLNRREQIPRDEARQLPRVLGAEAGRDVM